MRASSPLVATAILLIATIAGGMIIYNYLLNTLKAPKDYVSVTPISAQIVDLGDKAIVNIKVACIGSKPVTLEHMTIYPEGIDVQLNIEIKPGETKSITKIVSLDPSSGITLQDGKHYIIIYYGEQSTEPIEAELIR